MSLGDRLGRSLFVATAVGLAWGIRGDFGHSIGAMYPGAILALALAYVSGQRSLFLWMPILAALSAFGIGSGGTMSYGILHGYAQADTLINYGYGFLTLFLQGGAWGTFGGALIGLILERRPIRTSDWLGLLGSVFVGGWVVPFVVVDLIGFQINPPRNNSSIAFMGAAAGQLTWLACNNRPSGLRGGVLGFVGFALGMSAGRLLGNVSNMLQVPYGYTINHWNVMETSCGFIAGLIFAFGMLGRSYPEPPEDEKKNLDLASTYGILFVLGFLPVWHRIARIVPKAKLAEWAKSLKEYGYADPEGEARKILWLLDGLCVVGFIGAAIWLVIHFKRKQKWSALPVFWLSGTMLLYQNVNALYFHYPMRPKYVNMRNVFWVLFGLMAVYAAIARPGSRPDVQAEPQETSPEPDRFAWGRWAVGALASLALVVYLAGFVNKEQTMKTANTRWPIWTWSQGPFPGREAKP